MAAGGGAEAVRQRFLKRGADPEIAPDSPRSVAAGRCSELQRMAVCAALSGLAACPHATTLACFCALLGEFLSCTLSPMPLSCPALPSCAAHPGRAVRRGAGRGAPAGGSVSTREQVSGANSGGMKCRFAPFPLGRHAMDSGAKERLLSGVLPHPVQPMVWRRARGPAPGAPGRCIHARALLRRGAARRTRRQSRALAASGPGCGAAACGAG